MPGTETRLGNGCDPPEFPGNLRSCNENARGPARKKGWAGPGFMGWSRDRHRSPSLAPVPYANPKHQRLRDGLSRRRPRTAVGVRPWHARRFPHLVGGARTFVENAPGYLDQPAAFLSRTLG